MAQRRFTMIGIGVIAILFCIYSANFIYQTSFVVGSTRFFALFDDAMVSMRYAKNLVDGYGLVWNPGGPRVEGFTNPLWVFCMALIHLLPIQSPYISVVVQILAVILSVINLFVCAKIADRISQSSPFVTLSATLLIAFYLPLNNWSLQGMEVSLATLLISVAILLALKSSASNTFSYSLVYLLATLTTIRMDLVIPALIITGMLFVTQKAHRRRHILGFMLIFEAIGLQTIFRHEYYGDILPNTYYLKMVGYPVFLRITRGIYVMANFILNSNAILFLVPFVVPMIKRTVGNTLMIALISGQLLYSVYVGGDAWEWWGGSNRYVSIVMPAFFILFAYGLDNLRQQALGLFFQRSRLISGISIVAVVASLLNFNALRGVQSWAELILVAPPLHMAENRHHLEQALLVDQITDEQAKVAVASAGVLPYFANRYVIDILGKNDYEIAHATMRTSPNIDKYIYFYPGHLKWNYAYSYGTLKPDVIVELWNIPSEAAPILESDYQEVVIRTYHMYLRKDSPHIKWDQVKIAH